MWWIYCTWYTLASCMSRQYGALATFVFWTLFTPGYDHRLNDQQAMWDSRCLTTVTAITLTMYTGAGRGFRTGNLKTSALWMIIAACGWLVQVRGKPTVDPGLFMIFGVETCRNGTGYCLLGVDCTLDDDFLSDDSGGHCDGLKNAFTPPARFVCCKYNEERKNATVAKKPRPKPPAVTSSTVKPADITTITTAINEETTTEVVRDIFTDVNNQVFHEITPPTFNVTLKID